MPTIFYCRGKPQGCDAISIFKEARRVFIGYPLICREGEQEKKYDPNALQSCLVHPACSKEEWTRQIKGRENRNQSRNRNFIIKLIDLAEASIVVIPRPRQGIAYLGRISGSFEIVNDPPWGKEYLRLRKSQGLDSNDHNNHHIADVAQGWPVEEYRQTDLSRIPGWLRRSLFGRSTYGEFRPNHPLTNETAYSVLNRIYKGIPAKPMEWTCDTEEVKRRLVDAINNPYAFETLIVSLLQLEYPNEIWHHTGGPGDGGIDGLGSNHVGEVVGLMQAKLEANNAPELSRLTNKAKLSIRRYAAVLVPENPKKPTDETQFLDLNWIACTVLKHWRHLPLARTIRVGDSVNFLP